MSDTTPINDQTFQQEVLESSKPVLVDFGAAWCGPCKLIEPVLKQLAEEWGDRVRLVKVDVDHCPETTQRYGIMTVPTLLLFSKGQVLERLSGYQPKDRLAGKLKPHLTLR